jgi:hypothetical protein
MLLAVNFKNCGVVLTLLVFIVSGKNVILERC